MAVAAVVFAGWEVWSITRRMEAEEAYSVTDRWWLIVMSGLVQVRSELKELFGGSGGERLDLRHGCLAGRVEGLVGHLRDGTTIIGVTHMIKCDHSISCRILDLL